MGEHAVLIVGAGPAGKMLGAELRLAGIDALIVDRRAELTLESTRARGLHARTLEILDQRGIVDRFLDAGTPMQVSSFASVTLDLAGVPTRHPYGLALVQARTEALLDGWLDELSVPIALGREVTGLAQDEHGVAVTFADGTTARAQYVVGCDGDRSTVRRLAGIGFPGWDASQSSLIAEAEFDGEPAFGVRHDAQGTYAMGPGDDGRVGVVVREEDPADRRPPTLEYLREAITALWGTDFGLRRAAWVSRFTDATRQAEAYRAGRVLLAGDAAHIHSPMGGQGLNLGIQDAVNLGFKLARVAAGTSPDALLDTYHAERHPAAARAQQLTLALVALSRHEPRTDALRATVAELLGHDAPRRDLAARAAGLDVHYDLGDGHPLVGRRMPDLDLGSGRRVSEHLHAARPLLLAFDGVSATERVPTVHATYDGVWELPVLGAVTPPPAVLVRPDGHVAWAGGPGLDAALDRWF